MLLEREPGLEHLRERSANNVGEIRKRETLAKPVVCIRNDQYGVAPLAGEETIRNVSAEGLVPPGKVVALSCGCQHSPRIGVRATH
jgi:hypothetical protein